MRSNLFIFVVFFAGILWVLATICCILFFFSSDLLSNKQQLKHSRTVLHSRLLVFIHPFSAIPFHSNANYNFL